MRIIGEIPHPTYKITLLHMNARVSIQIEHGSQVQLFKFRDGDVVFDAPSAMTYCDKEFFSKVDDAFALMNRNQVETTTRLLDRQEEEFEEII